VTANAGKTKATTELEKNIIDTKKSAADIVEKLQSLMNVAFCYSNDTRKQRKAQTDSHITGRIVEYFKVVFRDDHGQSYIIKSDFCPGLVEFFKT